MDAFCNNYIGNSHNDWNVSHLVLDGEQLVQFWGVWGYQMRFETTQLKIGGTGSVFPNQGGAAMIVTRLLIPADTASSRESGKA